MTNILLIGGPGSTIGRALIDKLASPSVRVISTVHSWKGTADELPDNCFTHELDIRDSDEVKSLVDEVHQSHGGIDVLINNAGVLAGAPVATAKSSEWREVLEVDLTGVFHTCKHVARKMARARKGKIVNVSSRLAEVGGRGQSAYSAAKAGVIALTKCLAMELAPLDISVNAVCPGFISSGLNNFDSRAAQAAREQSLMDIDHNLSDIVNFIAFLCSDELQSVTGQVFHIDSRIN